MDFDLREHALHIHTADGQARRIALEPWSVADFYAEVMAALDALGLPVQIHTTPSEIADAIPFEEDRKHHRYNADAVHAFWRALVQADRVLKELRVRFIGKCSPVHFFWGSFDMAVTRFSGREAPPHPGGVPNFPDWVAREAYSHEVSSAGLFPGAAGGVDASFYTYPAPDGFERAAVAPDAAAWSKDLGEFLLPYDAVRTDASPDEALLDFLQSTCEVAADRAGWDRAALERDFGPTRR